MGLAPSGNGDNLGKSAVAKVPVPIFSQPLRVPSAVHGTRRGCEKMGLAPSENPEILGKSVVAKVPVPIFSQPRSVPTTLELNNLFLRGRLESGRSGGFDADGQLALVVGQLGG
jgi:hypothetical protein